MDRKTWAEIMSQGCEQSQESTMGLQTLGLLEVPKKKHLIRIDRDFRTMDKDLNANIGLVIDGELPWPIFLHGKAGVGKTCAALLVCDVANGWYKTIRGFLSEMISCQQGHMESDKGYKITPEGYWRRVSEANVAVLDEIGTTERVSSHHYDCLCEFIELRYNRPSIYISNHDLQKIELLYDDRIASRLASGTVIEVESKDRRIRKEMEAQNAQQ